MDQDTIGTAIKEEIWKRPLDFYRHVSYAMDHSTTKKFNFVFMRDDLVSREAHGWSYPSDLQIYNQIIKQNGTQILYKAMTGRHAIERPTIIKLAIGRLLTDMVNRMDTFIEGKRWCSCYIYLWILVCRRFCFVYFTIG